MKLKIYSSTGQLKMTVEPKESSTQTEEIQGGKVMNLGFVLPDGVALEVNDYADFNGSRYWATERYQPTQKSTVEWEYTVKLYGLENLISRFLVLDKTDGANEPEFSLTAPPREHVALIVASINAGFGTQDWKVGRVEGLENIVVDYHGKYCDEGLKAVATAAGTEYWIEGTTVNLCRCEHGESVTLGYRKGLTKIQEDVADNAKVYTRLFPSGSTRNIDPSSYGHSRLQLPDGQKYVDINIDRYGIIHHYESAAFADIYPRYTGTVSSVRSEELTGEDGSASTVYYFKDDSLPFDPNDYEIGGLVKRVTFQEGSELAGLGSDDNGTHYLEVNFDSKTREFEIITLFDDNGQLPGGVLVPKTGDRYIPWNIRMPQEYYTLAEQEFLTAAEAYNREHCVDVACYKAPTDYTNIESRALELHVGQRIRLESDRFFPGKGYKDSRITRITRRVNRPSQMDLEISDALSKSAIETISDDIESVRSYARSIAGSMALPDIIKTGDGTRPTDNNLLSALRSYRDLLRKDQDDRTDHALTVGGKLTAEDDLVSADFVSGLIGWIVSKAGNAELESLKVRSFMEIAELITNRLTAIEGDQVFTEGDTIETVTANADGSYTLKLHEKWEGYFTAQFEHNVIKGIYNNITAGLTPGQGQQTVHNAMYYTSWMNIISLDAAKNEITVILYPDAETPAGHNFPPEPMMKIARWGNSGDSSDPRYARRQTCFYLSSTEGRITKLRGVTKPIIDIGNIAATFGTLPELLASLDPRIQPGDDGIYVKTLAVQNFLKVDNLCRPVPTTVDVGPWQPGRKYSDGTTPTDTGEYERHLVWHLGHGWLCNTTHTSDASNAPAWNSTYWTHVAGDKALRLSLQADADAVDADDPRLTLLAMAELLGEDITSDPQLKWDWTRQTSRGGVTDTASDTAWNTAHENTTNTITLTRADMNYAFGVHPDTCIFTVTATLIDPTTGDPVTYDGKPMIQKKGIKVC